MSGVFFFVLAYFIELHRTCDVAVFASQEIATLLGHCFGTGQCGCQPATHSPLYPSTRFRCESLVSLARPPLGGVGNVLASGPVRLSQRRLSDDSASTESRLSVVSDIAATLTTMPSCAGTPAWDPGTGWERQSSRPLRHCASERLRLRLACRCESVQLGGDDSPAELPRLPVPESGGGNRPDSLDPRLATHHSEDAFNRVQPTPPLQWRPGRRQWQLRRRLRGLRRGDASAAAAALWPQYGGSGRGRGTGRILLGRIMPRMSAGPGRPMDRADAGRPGHAGATDSGGDCRRVAASQASPELGWSRWTTPRPPPPTLAALAGRLGWWAGRRGWWAGRRGWWAGRRGWWAGRLGRPCAQDCVRAIVEGPCVQEPSPRVLKIPALPHPRP